MITVSGTLPAIHSTEERWRAPDMLVLHGPAIFPQKWSRTLSWAISQSTCALGKFADPRDSVPNIFIELFAEESILSPIIDGSFLC